MNSKMKNSISTFLIIIIMLVFYQQENLAQIESVNLQKLTESSEMIIVGKVINTESEWNENRDRIFTKVKINADEFIKGNNGTGAVIITIPGGEVGEVGELYTDLPTFENDEEVLLFLKRDINNNYVVNSGLDGKFNISNKEVVGELKKQNSISNIESLKSSIKSFLNNK